MVVGTIVGSSIFVQPSEVSRAVPTFAGMLLVWVVAGALTWFGASICAELTSAYPRTGGVYVFLREMFSPAAGFLWGWAMFWSMHSGIIAAIAMVFGRYTATLIPMGDLGIRLTAVGGILVLSAINYVGVRPGSAVQTGLTVAKLGAIVALLALLFGAGALHAPVSAGELHAGGFFRGLVAGLFAFGGWHMVTYAAEETRDPERTIPRALMLGTAVVVVTYLALNTAYVLVLPFDAVLKSTHIAFDATNTAAGPTARHHPSRTASLLRDGGGSAAVHIDGRAASDLSHAVHRDRGAGDLVVAARAHRHLRHARLARRLHRVDLFRKSRARHAVATAWPRLFAGVSRDGFSVHAVRVRSDLSGDGDQSNRVRSLQRAVGTRPRRSRAARVFRLETRQCR